MNPIKYLWDYIKNDWKNQTTKEKILTIIALAILILFLAFICWSGICDVNRNWGSGFG